MKNIKKRNKMRLPFLVLTALFLLTLPLTAQEFTPQVKTFITVDTTTVTITNVTIIDGTGGAIKHNQTLIIQDDRIQQIGDVSSITIPSNALVIEGSGKTIIPGLVMLHEHLFYPNFFENWYSVKQMTFSFPRLYLAGGVTTIRTTGSIQPQSDLNIKKWINEGKMTGPKMDVTSPFIDREGMDIPSLGSVKSSEDVFKEVNFWADKGITS